MYSTMNNLKRKSASNGMEPRYYTRKQRKISDKKAKQKKGTLKTVFSKVKTDNENGGSIYKIKDTKESPHNLETQLNEESQHTTVNDDVLFSQIPEFTDKDIAEFINQTDLDLLFGEYDTIDNAVETFGSTSTHNIPMISTTNQSFDQSTTVAIDETNSSSCTGQLFQAEFINQTDLDLLFGEYDTIDSAVETFGSTSTHNISMISTTNRSFDQSTTLAIDETNSRSCTGLDGATDLSVKKNGGQNSTTTTSNPQMPASSSSMSRVDAYFKVMRYRREYGIPSASSLATNRVDKRRHCMVARNECSSTIGLATTTRINETTTSNKYPNIDRSSLTSRDNPKILKSPVMLLEEILGLQGLLPIYDINPIVGDPRNAVFQCRVWIATQNAYGRGMSTIEAKNHAATSLLEKLISNKYFGNVIGQLQEFCMSRGWPLPKYVDELDMHRMNANGFIVSCTVRKQKLYGQGKKKKMAKLFAAYKMWLKVSAPKRYDANGLS